MGRSDSQLLEAIPSMKRRSKGLLVLNNCNNGDYQNSNNCGKLSNNLEGDKIERGVRFDEKLSSDRVIVDPCSLKMKQKAGVWYRFEHLQMFKKDIKKTIISARKRGALCFANTKKRNQGRGGLDSDNGSDVNNNYENNIETQEEEETCLRGIEHLYSTEVSRRIKKMKKSHVVRVLMAQNQLRNEGFADPDGSYLRNTSLESSEEFSIKAQIFGEQDSDEAFCIYCEESEMQQQQQRQNEQHYQLPLHEQVELQLNIRGTAE